MSAAGAPNEEGDRTGGINLLFTKVYKFRLQAKALKKTNRNLYYVGKWGIFGGLLAVFVLI
jgi:beta-hydroxylase